MAYKVSLSVQARADVREATSYIRSVSVTAAARWFEGFLAAAASLQDHPQRCPRAPEDEFFDDEMRHLLYGKPRSIYRIVFWIDEERDAVRILAVRHGARLPLQPDDVDWDF